MFITRPCTHLATSWYSNGCTGLQVAITWLDSRRPWVNHLTAIKNCFIYIKLCMFLVTFTLTRWPWAMVLSCTSWKCTYRCACLPKLNISRSSDHDVLTYRLLRPNAYNLAVLLSYLRWADSNEWAWWLLAGVIVYYAMIGVTVVIYLYACVSDDDVSNVTDVTLEHPFRSLFRITLRCSHEERQLRLTMHCQSTFSHQPSTKDDSIVYCSSAHSIQQQQQPLHKTRPFLL